MSRHTDFILSPIHDLLAELVVANSGIGKGIETFPLSEYVLQAVFLKMTGSQEQKMKCICWELATLDYQYRYDRYSRAPLGECSAYKEKGIIYKDLIAQIKKHNPGFDLTTVVDTVAIRAEIISLMESLFSSSNLSTWEQRNFFDFMTDLTIIESNRFGTEANLLDNVLQERYELLYKHRNRCAHNTLSYQENLPTLKALQHKDYKYDNYFVRFALLILIDTVFIELYKVYLAIVEED